MGEREYFAQGCRMAARPSRFQHGQYHQPNLIALHIAAL
jgi:hypothetical protein